MSAWPGAEEQHAAVCGSARIPAQSTWPDSDGRYCATGASRPVRCPATLLFLSATGMKRFRAIKAFAFCGQPFPQYRKQGKPHFQFTCNLFPRKDSVETKRFHSRSSDQLVNKEKLWSAHYIPKRSIDQLEKPFRPKSVHRLPAPYDRYQV